MAPSRPSRLQRLERPVDKNFSSLSPPSIDISPSYINQPLHYNDQDVVRELSQPPESDTSSIRQQFLLNGFHPQQLETSRFQFQTPQHGSSLIRPTIRPRTPPVPLFTHHGLPLSLPPPPRTTFVAPSPIPNPDDTDAFVNFVDSLFRGSYSTMRAEQNNTSVPGAGHAPTLENSGGKWGSLAEEQMLNLITAFDFPEDLPDYSCEDYLTSPSLDTLDQSPEETPFIATPIGNHFTPFLFDNDSFDSDGGMPPPFGAVMPYLEEACAAGSTDTALPSNYESFDFSPYITSPLMNTASLPDASKVEQFTPALPSLDDAQYVIPETPSLSPSALSMPSATTSVPVLAPPSASPARPTKPLPTGTRRGVTAASLVPLDAPTQTRRYITPSVTSRKVIPAAFKGKKRQHSETTEGGGEEGEVMPDESTLEAIEAKRRQNTQAARRSRQRKLEYTRELEESIVTLTDERNMWQSRAYEAENKLRLHGIP